MLVNLWPLCTESSHALDDVGNQLRWRHLRNVEWYRNTFGGVRNDAKRTKIKEDQNKGNVKRNWLNCIIVGKKNNQSSHSATDRELPTLGPTDKVGNSANLVSDIFRWPSGWDFSVCNGDRRRSYFSRLPDRDILVTWPCEIILSV